MEYPGGVEVEYPDWRWRILEEKRRKALEVVKALEGLKAPVIVHGSIARGDVDRDSDIDVVVLEPIPASLVELALESAGFRVVYREIVQATPSNTPKVYFHLDHWEERVVSVPLAPLRPREREFYKWGGELDSRGLSENRRVPGVNKNLTLIIPTRKGHIELEVEGNEHIVARILGVSLETVEERVRVLTRRRIHGRTGVYVKHAIPPGRSIEEEVERLAREYPGFRRILSKIL